MNGFQVWIARGSILSLAPIVEYGSRFLRTAILSRLLVPNEFGISMAIATMLGLAALITDLSLDKFVVINTSDDSAHSLGAVHVFSIARGLLLSCVLLVTASGTAKVFGVPELTGSFAIAALCPLLGSFAHLSIKQIQQHFQYTSEAIAQVVTQLSALAAGILAAFAFRDHRAILASFLIEAVVYTIMSHLLANSRYGLSSRRAILQKAASYGFPLLLNGIGLAALSQLDRMLVGSWLGMQTLAAYAVILTLSTLPTSLILRVFGGIGVSTLLQKKEGEASVLAERYSLLTFFSSLIGAGYALTVALTLDWLTPLVFGLSYQVAHGAHVILVAIVYLRVLRGTAPTMFFLVTGKTGELAILNLISGIGIVIAFWLLHYWLSLETVLFSLLIGDLLGLIVMVFVSSARNLAPRMLSHVDLMMSAISVAIIVGAMVWRPESSWEARTEVFLLGLLGIGAQLVVGVYTQRSIGLVFKPKVQQAGN